MKISPEKHKHQKATTMTMDNNLYPEKKKREHTPNQEENPVPHGSEKTLLPNGPLALVVCCQECP